MVGGNHKDPTSSSTYASVVLRDSVRVYILLGALNYVDVLSTCTQGEYLNYPYKENVWFISGAEFGLRKGIPIVIAISMYGMKSADDAWQEKLAH